MLEPRHIMRLGLARWRVTEHETLPPPEHVTRPLTAQFSTINGSVLTTLLGVTPEDFGKQLQYARELGAEYICTTEAGETLGISVSTSLIHKGGIIRKNLIIPRDALEKHSKLDERVFVAAFVRGDVIDGELKYTGEVDIAGWATSTDIKMCPKQEAPATFTTKLKNVIALPCTELRPIDELTKRIGNMCVHKGEQT